MLPDITSAVRLQEVDIRLTELAKEIASLPKHIAEIEKKLEAHQRKLEADRAALTANQKDRKKLEDARKGPIDKDGGVKHSCVPRVCKGAFQLGSTSF